MINNSIKEVVKNRWYYNEVLLKLDSCYWTIMLYEKAERQSKQWWRLCKILTGGERMTPPDTPFVGASVTYSRIIFIYVVLVSLLLFLCILKNIYIMTVHSRYQNGFNDFVSVSLLIILNIFYTLFWCFHCWLTLNKYISTG